ncbi:multidrug DMT transporter permease [Pseudomonas straminea]|uniref:EamA domain-containing membrane protein RarD n=1 Tax=Pseudomonas straminea TaxID=47882 RepID=A0A1I1S3U3_PSEOC|nr:DMT family transporter [Pseudomonas straminea]GLX11899.1 multidrug DMT transporter permease [Pseudomonas straminea]SFD41149.1 EamA domain-containing membrane protein RarD [Pseudomonas straminea]
MSPSAFFQRCASNGSLFAILSAAGFSMKAIFVKLAYAAAPVEAITLLAMRMTLALPLFLWLVWLSRGGAGGRFSPGDGARVVVLALFGYYLSSLFDFYGLQYITAGLERLILFTYPTLVLVFQMIAFRERPSRRMLLAMAVCYLGLGVALMHDIGATDMGSQVIIGSLWVFASAVTYALYYLGTGVMVKRLGSMRLAGLAGSASSLMVLAHFFISEPAGSMLAQPAHVWLCAALMAMISTVLPVYWMALAIQRIGATNTAAVGNLGPVLTIFAAWALLGEAITPYQMAGLALVMFGIWKLKAGAAKKVVVADVAGGKPSSV